MTEKRIVLRDVAKKAGVHLTTAARAMKNDPRVKPATLAQVQRVAKELGYSPDPMLAALSTYRSTTRQPLYHGTVAWLTDFPTEDGWKVESFSLYRQGAAEALAEHGYQLEDHWLQTPGMSLRRSAQILQSRGVRGLLVCPLPIQHARLNFPWERFATVTFGYSLLEPALHRVTTSHYQNMQTCFRQLYNLGYRRPGWVIWDDISKRVAEQWTAAYRTPAIAGEWNDAIPSLRLEERPSLFSEENRGIFLKWFKAHRPDVILVVDRHILDWLIEAGVRVPQDVAYVSPSLQESNQDHAGVLEPSLEVGHTAGEFLVGMLNRGEFGIPRIPRRILLDGLWQHGSTIRALA
jgi:DNA-binding LacI/PurR family transcriptional regulator